MGKVFQQSGSEGFEYLYQHLIVVANDDPPLHDLVQPWASRYSCRGGDTDIVHAMDRVDIDQGPGKLPWVQLGFLPSAAAA